MKLIYTRISLVLFSVLLLTSSSCGKKVECENVNQVINGRSQLHSAAFNNDYALAKCLIDKGAYVNRTDDKGWTPLHSAAMRNNIGVAKLLLKNGAFTHLTDPLGDTPLDVAKKATKWKDTWEMVALLEKY